MKHHFLDCVTVGSCVTVEGEDIGANCVFPFILMGVKHYGCTTIDGSELPWCSTLVDDDGVHVGGKGKWGDCGPTCKEHIDGIVYCSTYQGTLFT